MASSGTVPQFRCAGCTSQGAAPAGACGVGVADGAGFPPPRSPADLSSSVGRPCERALTDTLVRSSRAIGSTTTLDRLGSIKHRMQNQCSVRCKQLTKGTLLPGMALPPIMVVTVPSRGISALRAC